MKKSCKNLAFDMNSCYYLPKVGVLPVLIEFKVKNFMSFRDEAVLSFVADSNRELFDTNVAQVGNLNLLKTIAVFGANASGKTNLFNAFSLIIQLILGYHKHEDIISAFEHYKLNDDNISLPIEFEVSFLHNDKRHRYGIHIQNEKIVKEYLYFVPSTRESLYFERKNNDIIKTGTYFEDKRALEYIKPTDTCPFLYTLANKTVDKFGWAKSIQEQWNLQLCYQESVDDLLKKHLEKSIFIDNTISKKSILSILKDADIGISDISLEEVDDTGLDLIYNALKKDDDDKKEQHMNTFVHHKKYNQASNEIGIEKFALQRESNGTQKLYILILPILMALGTGGALYVDEIENSLHPLLVDKIVRMFNDPNTNKRNAQLIFTTHNVLLMRSELLRRDQIYFTDKDKFGASKLYSLYDIDIDIRKNSNYLNNYLSGRFGAIPYLGSFRIEDIPEKKQAE